MADKILNEAEQVQALGALVAEIKKLSPTAAAAFSKLQPRGANVVAGVLGEKLGKGMGELIDKGVRAQRTAKFFGIQMLDALKRTIAEKKRLDAMWEQTVRNAKAEQVTKE